MYIWKEGDFVKTGLGFTEGGRKTLTHPASILHPTCHSSKVQSHGLAVQRRLQRRQDSSESSADFHRGLRWTQRQRRVQPPWRATQGGRQGVGTLRRTTLQLHQQPHLLRVLLVPCCQRVLLDSRHAVCCGQWNPCLRPSPATHRGCSRRRDAPRERRVSCGRHARVGLH